MDRRHFLARCGTGLCLLAGCSAGPRNGGSGGTKAPGPTDSPSGGVSSTPTDVAPLDGSWESYRHDAGNTAATDDPGPTENPTETWQFATATGAPVTAPAAADGAFLVVTRSGVLYAREAADGSLRWSRPWSADANVDPVASDGTVVVADGDTLAGFGVDTGEQRWRTSLDGPVIGLGTTDGGVVVTTETGLATVTPDDGTERWREPVKGTVVTAPGVGAGTVAAGLSSGDVLAFDADTGDRRWRTSVESTPTFAPAVGVDRVYVGTGSRLVALNGERGTQQWAYSTEYPVAAPPVTTVGGVSIATLNDDAEADATGTDPPGAAGTPTPTAEDVRRLEADLVTFAPEDGSERWRVEVTDRYSFTSGPPAELPLVSANGLVLLGLVGDLIAYDATTGERVWEADADGVVPAVADGVVSTGRVGMDVADGSVRWRYRTGRGVNAAPAVVGNTVFAGSDDHYLYALTASTGTLDWAVPTDDMVRSSPAVGDDAVYAGTMNGSLYAFDRSDGTRLWRTDIGGQIQSPSLADGTVYVGNFSRTLFALDTEDGTERWRTEVDSDRFVALTLAVADGAVYGGANGDLRAFEVEDGRERWRHTTGRERVIQSSPAATDGRLFVNQGDSLRAFDTEDGSERWSRATGGAHHPPAVHDGTVYAPGDGTLYAFDADDGTERWRTGTGDDLLVAIGDGVVYGMGYDTPVLAFDPEDGNVLWRHGEFRGTTSPALADEFLFVGDDTGRVRAIGPEPE